MLSESENNTIAAGFNDVVMDHFEDAVDRNGSTDLVFRSGSTKAIQPGSWIVNCTGISSTTTSPTSPTSPSGAVVSIQPRSVTLHLTSFMGYFMTHLLFLGKIRDVPLYELDVMDLRRKSNAAFPYTLFTLVQHNLSLISDSVPSKVFPSADSTSIAGILAARVLSMARFMLTHRREREHQRRTLDTVRERFDVRCGPLDLGRRDGCRTSQAAAVSRLGLLVEDPVRHPVEELEAVFADHVVAAEPSTLLEQRVSSSLQTYIVGTVTFLPVSRGSLSSIARYQLSAAVSAPGSPSP